MTPTHHVVHIIKVILVAGAERHLLTLLPALHQHGIQSSLVLLVEPSKPMHDYRTMTAEADIPTYPLTINSHADYTLLPRLRNQLRTLQPDIVHTHLLHADLYGGLAARSLGVRWVVSRHNDNAFRRRWYMRLLHRALWSQTAQGVAISEAIRQFCITVEGAPASRIHTVHYGATPSTPDRALSRSILRDQLNLPTDALIIGTMSRLIEQKGLSYGVQAFAQIAGQHPHAHLVIAGTGDREDALREQVAALDMQRRVHLIGWQPEPTVVLAAYDILLMPSLWEGFGLVMLEAMAQGLPIVGSHVSAIPEVVAHDETGLLVPPRDVNGLAAALDTLLSDETRRDAMGAAAQARLAAQFSPSAMAAQTAALYWRAL